MTSPNINNIHGIVLYITQKSKEWVFSVSYPSILRSFLLEEKSKKPASSDSDTDYDFVTKIIWSISNNSEKDERACFIELEKMIDNYLKNKNTTLGNKIAISLFWKTLLKLNKKDSLFHSNNEKIKNFLGEFKSNEEKIQECLSFLKLYYLNIKTQQIWSKKQPETKAISLAYLYLVLSSTKVRNKTDLIDFYLIQSDLEKNILSTTINNQTKVSLLEIAVMLKILHGQGIYLPEIEKENYLSNFAQDIIKENYLKRIEELDKIKKIPVWAFISGLLLLESASLLFPAIGQYLPESLSILQDVLKYMGFLNTLPVWAILSINALVIGIIIYVQRKYLKKKL